MAYKRPKARILERTTTAGNGPYALAGAIDGSYNSFSAFMSIGDVTTVTVVEPGVAFWTGIATYSAANQITLTTVEETSGTFGAGTKEVFAGTLAAKSAFFDDITGAIVTGGTLTAYTISSYRNYDSLARMNAALIAFTPHTANGSPVTLNVDGLGAKPLRLAPGVELQSNVLVQGTPYMATYNNSDVAWYLHGLGGNAYGIPLGGGLDYWGATAPSSAFAFPFGQALSQTTYAALYALFGPNRYGTDSGGNFLLPDVRGRLVAGKNDMGGTGAGRLTTATMTPDGNTLGGTGGGETVTLVTGNLPAYTPSGNITNGNITITQNANTQNSGASVAAGGNPGIVTSAAATITASQASSTFTGNPQGGGSNPLRVLSPLIVANKLIRII